MMLPLWSWGILYTAVYGRFLIPALYAVFFTQLAQGVIRQSEFPLDQPNAFTKPPMLNGDYMLKLFSTDGHSSSSPSSNWRYATLTSIAEYHYEGMVYNLAVEDDETYIADGVLVHNCRSTIAPVVSEEFDFLDKGAKRAARGAEGGTQVSADMTYYDFLKQQPAWFVDKALGPVRGAIFRNAGMTPEEFRVASVDGFGRPLTLREMAEVDKRVADYLKGE